MSAQPEKHVPTEATVVENLEEFLLELLSTAQLTEVYNILLDRDVKKLSQKSVGIEAIMDLMEKPNFEIRDHAHKLPKDVLNLWKANGFDLTAAAKENKKKTFAEVYTPEVTEIETEGFNFNTAKGAGAYMRDLIRGTANKGEKVNGILDPDEIVEKTKIHFPSSKCSAADVAYNKSELRKAGYEVPIFRKKKKD